ncbi:MAG: DeoR/GlpR family DNA-binding transcription regulator [Candidatus Melainabacteria bacterium]|nr:DeoR/GlpR family DNA-binding transcription regulator [Candidatus Melainabacteria bacterium]
MFTEERRQRILSHLNVKGKASSVELASELLVSEDTIRRDLKELSENGLLKKVHGGAMAISPVPFEYSARIELNLESKRRMAAEAARLIQPGMLVFIDGGTSTQLIAEFLPVGLVATFVTHSAANAIAFAKCRTSKIILLGGMLVPELLINEGPEVLSAIERFSADLALISVQGLNIEDGATVSHYQDALVKTAFIQRASELAVVAGKEKLGFALHYRICASSELDYLITDESKSGIKDFGTLGFQIITV